LKTINKHILCFISEKYINGGIITWDGILTMVRI